MVEGAMMPIMTGCLADKGHYLRSLTERGRRIQRDHPHIARTRPADRNMDDPSIHRITMGVGAGRGRTVIAGTTTGVRDSGLWIEEEEEEWQLMTVKTTTSRRVGL